ncbi:hypothetical protein HAX54_027449 [Datura stramonium]|uniref:Protein kinase domain-containing protein n=1 Tax=Datura stramonium TaxID=4076 RepID=A0ABS8S8V5_DATST|nr:hypothetical protein [Datura stramonium]
MEAGNLVISVQVLRNVTNNFAPENELGRGGFGVVYKGELDDGTKIAVKRMEAGVISSNALDEFRSEISVLSKVRHRNLVSLLGYSVEGNELILLMNTCHKRSQALKYLLTTSEQKYQTSARETCSDGEKNSVVTRLLNFRYLAPEYAVTGKITTKADVFSLVVLMELLTGWMALDEDRPNESQYLVAWFWNIKSSKEKLIAAIDPALDVKQESTFESICTVAELAGHCTARESANALTCPMPLPLNQMVKGWQESEGKDLSCVDLEDTKGSIPARPTGFAESFTSVDGR